MTIILNNAQATLELLRRKRSWAKAEREIQRQRKWLDRKGCGK